MLILPPSRAVTVFGKDDYNEQKTTCLDMYLDEKRLCGRDDISVFDANSKTTWLMGSQVWSSYTVSYAVSPSPPRLWLALPHHVFSREYRTL